MKNQICIVTGANSGIGKETSRGLAKNDATVIMVCRSRHRGEAALADIKATTGNDDVHLMVADLSSQESIRQFSQEFKAVHQNLHILVNNAGGMFFKRQLSVDNLELTFALNHLGYFLLTNLLLDVLKASAPARIINVASNAHFNQSIDFDDLQNHQGYRFMNVYGISKLANILFTYELARRLEGSGVTANCLHPGVVATNLFRSNGLLGRIGTIIIKPFLISPKIGAETPIYLATSPEVEGITGKYFVDKKETPSSKVSRDLILARQLWVVSERLTGLA